MDGLPVIGGELMLKVVMICIFAVVVLYLYLIAPRMCKKPDRKAFLGVHYAHRGLFDNEGDVPENSLAAFKKAVDEGYGIELDVQLSKDKVPVVFHDAGLYRMCGVDTSKWDWPGEGDDMIFIDGESWPPQLHGTGTEDYVNMAWCPTQEYHAPYHGIILPGKDNWKDKITYYRYHIQDPVMFEKSVRVTIEHGHNNHRSDDWSSTAYWYQTEPHKEFPKLLEVEERLPYYEEIL